MWEAELIDAFFKQTLTKEQHDILDEWVESDVGNIELFEKIVDEYYSNRKLPDY